MFEVIGKFKSHWQNMAQRLCYIIFWHIVTYNIFGFFWICLYHTSKMPPFEDVWYFRWVCYTGLKRSILAKICIVDLHRKYNTLNNNFLACFIYKIFLKTKLCCSPSIQCSFKKKSPIYLLFGPLYWKFSILLPVQKGLSEPATKC